MTCNLFLSLPDNVKMPALGYGTWQADNLEKALDAALEAGYRHIDTAQAYRNEEIIGTVLKKWFDSGKLKREEVFITSKLFPLNSYPEKVHESLQESLKNLQLDYIDLFLIHFPITIVVQDGDVYGHPNVDYLDVWKKFEELHDSGKVKAVGVSNFSITKLQRILKSCRIKPACNQVEVQIYFQQKELVNFCKKNDIPVVAYSPMGGDRRAKSLEEDSVKEIAKKHSKTPTQVLLRFLVQLGVAPIPKSITPSRIQENIDIFDFSLDEKDMGKLRLLDMGPRGRARNFGSKHFGRAHEHPYYEF